MCQAEDGDEEDPWSSADEYEVQPHARSRLPSAPTQPRPQVVDPYERPGEAAERGRAAPQSVERRFQAGAQQPRPRAPFDPFEALFGGPHGDSLSRRRTPSPLPLQQTPGSLRSDSRYEPDPAEEDADMLDPREGRYLLDPRTGQYFYEPRTRSQVPWYAHGSRASGTSPSIPMAPAAGRALGSRSREGVGTPRARGGRGLGVDGVEVGVRRAG